jgi:hypothetical protein
MFIFRYTNQQLIDQLSALTHRPRNPNEDKKLIQLHETATGKHIGIICNFQETIHTNNKGNDAIGSVELVKLKDFSQMLLVGGRDNFNLQIYLNNINNNESKNCDRNDKFVLKNTLQFEDNGTGIESYNSTITTDEHVFVKA